MTLTERVVSHSGEVSSDRFACSSVPYLWKATGKMIKMSSRLKERRREYFQCGTLHSLETCGSTLVDSSLHFEVNVHSLATLITQVILPRLDHTSDTSSFTVCFDHKIMEIHIRQSVPSHQSVKKRQNVLGLVGLGFKNHIHLILLVDSSVGIVSPL